MTSVFTGQRPDLTPAQVVGVLVAGVPVIATLLHAFGVYDVSPEQQQALGEALTWGGVLAGLLFASDAGVRAARNAADARRGAAALGSHAEPGAHVPEFDDPELGEEGLQAARADLGDLLGPESGAVPDEPELVR
jgi:hypothetical protein